jgi:hypothetical protein
VRRKKKNWVRVRVRVRVAVVSAEALPPGPSGGFESLSNVTLSLSLCVFDQLNHPLATPHPAHPPTPPPPPPLPLPCSRIEVFCYALSPDDGSCWRARIASEAEHLLDVSAWSAADIARRISADGIHVAINLNVG